MAGEPDIRQVIAFPKVSSGSDPLTGAPTPMPRRGAAGARHPVARAAPAGVVARYSPGCSAPCAESGTHVDPTLREREPASRRGICRTRARHPPGKPGSHGSVWMPGPGTSWYGGRMLEVFGDSTRDGEWAAVRLRVDGDRIVDADAAGLDRDLAGLTLLEAAAVGGETLAVDALANALGAGLPRRADAGARRGRDERRRRQRGRAPARRRRRGRRHAAALARPGRARRRARLLLARAP